MKKTMNEEEVLNLIDSIMHEFASSYRMEAKKRVEDKFNIKDEMSEQEYQDLIKESEEML